MICTHAQPGQRPNAVVCSLGLYGGHPSVGVCKVCPQRDPAAVLDPQVMAHLEKQWSGCKGCGQSRPDVMDQ